MRELRLVGLSDDGTYLILRANGDETPMSLPLDERLHAALRGDRARLGQLEIQMDSQLRPKDIQARIRSGESAQSVAAAAGAPLDKVMRFAGPVLAEREHIAERAQVAVIRRSGGEVANRPLRELVAERAGAYDADPETIEWDSWRRDDGRWQVTAGWLVGDDQRRAEFTFDASGRSVVPDNDEARAVAGEAPDQSEVIQPAGPSFVDPEGEPVERRPARLSVVTSPDDAEPEPEATISATPGRATPGPATPGPATPGSAGDSLGAPHEQPTVPVPVADSRSGRPGDSRRGRDDRRRPRTRDSRPDPWAAQDDTNERLRLSDIATRVEVDGDDAAEQVAASAPAASGDVASRPAENPSGQTKRSRSKRPSVPSWDEIMFGRRDKE